MIANPKEQLHRLVDALPESEVPTARRLLEALSLLGHDPVGVALAAAPLDDEPETDEERAAVAAARAELERGEIVSHDEIRREFGL